MPNRQSRTSYKYVDFGSFRAAVTRARSYQDKGFWDDFYSNLKGQELEWSAPVSEVLGGLGQKYKK